MTTRRGKYLRNRYSTSKPQEQTTCKGSQDTGGPLPASDRVRNAERYTSTPPIRLGGSLTTRLSLLVAGQSPRTPRFNSRPVHMRFVLDELSIRQGFLRALRLSSRCDIPLLLHTYLPFTDHVHYWLSDIVLEQYASKKTPTQKAQT